MPEFATSRPNSRQEVPTIAHVGLQPQAGFASTYVTPQDTGTMRLAKSLATVNDRLQPFIAAKEAEAAQIETMQGAMARAQLGATGNQEDVAKGLDAQIGYYRQQGYLGMAGQLQAFHDINRMQAQLSQADLGAVSAQDLESMLQGMTDQATVGADNPEFLQGYMGKVESFKQQARQEHAKAQAAQVENTVTNATFANMVQVLDQTRGQGPETTAAALNAMRQQQKALGFLSYQQLDAMEYNAALYLAKQRMDPTVLDVLSQPRPDGTPGLDRNPKYALDIASARKQITNEADRAATERNSANSFIRLEGYRKEMIQAAAAGSELDSGWYERELLQDVQNGTLSAAEARGVMSDLYKQNATVANTSSLVSRLFSGQQIERDKEGKAAYDRFLGGLPDDASRIKAIVQFNWLPEDMKQNLDNVVGQSANKDGTLPTSLSNAIEQVRLMLTLPGGERVVRGNLDAVSADMLITAAQQMNGTGGQMPASAAWDIASAGQDPSTRAALKELSPQEMDAAIARADVTDPNVKALLRAQIGIAYTRAGDINKAADAVIKQFRLTHQEGPNGVWVPITGKPLSSEQLDMSLDAAYAIAIRDGYGSGTAAEDDITRGNLQIVPAPNQLGRVKIMVGGIPTSGTYSMEQLARYGSAVQEGQFTSEDMQQFMDFKSMASEPLKGWSGDYSMADYQEDVRRAEYWTEWGLMDRMDKWKLLGYAKAKAQATDERLFREQLQGFENRRAPLAKGPLVHDAAVTDPKDKQVLNLIARAESAGNYNAIFGEAKQQDVQLTDMTLDQVVEFQKHLNITKGHTPVGRYQIIGSTLKSTMKKMGLSGSEKFTPQLQDKMAIVLANEAGLAAWKRGEITHNQFLGKLSQVWAGLPMDVTGKSAYESDGVNHATVGYGTAIDALRAFDGGPGI